jgi:hypothetical protein
MDKPPPRITTELAAVEGTEAFTRALQTELAAVLAAVLEKRHAVRRHLGATADEVEEEIAHVCKLFELAARRPIGRKIIDAYQYHRYPETIRVAHADAPEETRELVAKPR